MKSYHKISNLRFEGSTIVGIIDGSERRFPISEISPVLAKATEIERNTFEISPSGYGIHWPLLDEDLSIDGLLGIDHGQKQEQKEYA